MQNSLWNYLTAELEMGSAKQFLFGLSQWLQSSEGSTELDIWNGSFIWLEFWLVAGNLFQLSARVTFTCPTAWGSQSSWVSYMAPGFPHSKCTKRTKQKVHGFLWTCLKSHVDCFAESIDYKWVTNVSQDSGGEAIEPTWEGCQKIGAHFLNCHNSLLLWLYR